MKIIQLFKSYFQLKTAMTAQIKLRLEPLPVPLKRSFFFAKLRVAILRIFYLKLSN